MKKLIILILFCNLILSQVHSKESKPNQESKQKDYSIEVTVKDIPQGQQTLFIPIKIDTMILDFDKVAIEDLSAQNILAVASNSKDKVGPGIGLIKLDENGLPNALTLRAILKPVGQGETSISLAKVAEEPALPSKGAVINTEVSVNIKSNNEIDVTEKTEKNKKRLSLSESKLTLNVHRSSPKEESIFVPIIIENNVLDLDETFGHAVVAPGIAAKSFSSGSLHEGGTGIEILLTEVAPLDFEVDIDLIPKKSGKTNISVAFPQKGHTAIVRGPNVEINPTVISVAKN